MKCQVCNYGNAYSSCDFCYIKLCGVCFVNLGSIKICINCIEEPDYQNMIEYCINCGYKNCVPGKCSCCNEEEVEYSHNSNFCNSNNSYDVNCEDCNLYCSRFYSIKNLPQLYPCKYFLSTRVTVS